MMVSQPDSVRIRARKRLELLGVVRGRARHRIRGPLPQQLSGREMKVRLIQLVIGLVCTLFFLGIDLDPRHPLRKDGAPCRRRENPDLAPL